MLIPATLAANQAGTSSSQPLSIKYKCISIEPHAIGVAGTGAEGAGGGQCRESPRHEGRQAGAKRGRLASAQCVGRGR